MIQSICPLGLFRIFEHRNDKYSLAVTQLVFSYSVKILAALEFRLYCHL